MSSLHILSIEDEYEVRDAIIRDLEVFESLFVLDGVGDAAEAMDVIQDIENKGERIALVYCDHIIPGEKGVDFLSRLACLSMKALEGTRKALFTGQAGHKDTIQAINQGGIHYYLEKPWEAEGFRDLTKKLLTDYVLEQKLPPLPYMKVLDAKRLSESIHSRYFMNEAG